MIIKGALSFDDVKPTLAKIFAFDNFVYNEDRHCKNFVVRSQRTGHALLALDYSRAWLYHGFPSHGLPFAPNQITMVASRWITATFGQYLTEASTKETLDRLEAVTDSHVSTIIENHPQTWITAAEKAAIVSWWASTARKNRIDNIRQGIKDGKYL